ncbi:TIGR03032 family protein [Lewinella sp. 4G2]|uniref:TIGR03032 family protein n=1 Tax=Lewinella sp. 4G2 TaxID=1803372 RepID=UPI0007B4B3BD|nr:TIGR03032 family protein [Lewinella sp. 4G2]OAV43199.1 TIGR03032 family protein [Lewinella sp. 4G2]
MATPPKVGQAPPPFALQSTPQLPELLHQLGITLMLSTYQAGKVVMLSAVDDERIVQLPRSFNRPMGITEDPATDRLAIACRDEVIVLRNAPMAAPSYPNGPGKYDALYLPRMTYHTGPLDIHDLRFGDGGKSLYAVNTRFSCIMQLGDQYSFTPVWQPKWIDALMPEDRCHLNGMAMREGRPAYATAFSTTNTPQGWRDTVTTSGVIVDVASGETISSGVAMPHSPRWYDGKLYVLQTAKGLVSTVDLDSGKLTTVCHVGGFVRGMARAGDYLFVATSKLRKNSSTFAQLDFAKSADRASVVVIYLPSGAKVGEMAYAASVDEIYDVHVLVGKRRVNVLNTITNTHQRALTSPAMSFWGSEEGEG